MRGSGGRNNRAVVAALILILLAGCAPPPPATDAQKELPPIPVTVAPVRTVPIQRSVEAVGTLNGFEEISLGAKVDGRVLAVKADVGDTVVPGQVLLELDPVDAKLAVDEMRQGLAAELAKLGLTQLPAGEFDVEAVPAVRRATVAVVDAQRKFKQKQGLAPAVSKDDLDTAETEFKLAEASKTQVVTEAKAVLAMARLRQATLSATEQKLADCTISVPKPTVPLPGGTRYLVCQRLVGEGEMVRAMPDTRTYKLVLADVLKLRAAIPERFTPDVVVGLPVEVSVEAYPGVVFPGKVARVSPAVDPQNRTFQAEIEVPNPTGKLKVGGFAKASVRTKSESATVVPAHAVVTYAGVTKVFVAAGDKAKAVEVRVGTRDKDWVEVGGELPAGVSVITSGFSQIVDGSAIRVR